MSALRIIGRKPLTVETWLRGHDPDYEVTSKSWRAHLHSYAPRSRPPGSTYLCPRRAPLDFESRSEPGSETHPVPNIRVGRHFLIEPDVPGPRIFRVLYTGEELLRALEREVADFPLRLDKYEHVMRAPPHWVDASPEELDALFMHIGGPPSYGTTIRCFEKDDDDGSGTFGSRREELSPRNIVIVDFLASEGWIMEGSRTTGQPPGAPARGIMSHDLIRAAIEERADGYSLEEMGATVRGGRLFEHERQAHELLAAIVAELLRLGFNAQAVGDALGCHRSTIYRLAAANCDITPVRGEAANTLRRSIGRSLLQEEEDLETDNRV